MQKRPIGTLEATGLGALRLAGLLAAVPRSRRCSRASSGRDGCCCSRSYVAFLVLYFAGHLIRTPRMLWIVAGLDAIAIFGSTAQSVGGVRSSSTARR